VAESHSSDIEPAADQKERKRQMARERYWAMKLADPDFCKKSYRKAKERNPDVNRQKYRRAIAKDPEYNKKKHARNPRKSRPRRPRRPQTRLRTPEQIDRERDRGRRKYEANREKKIKKVVARQRQRYQDDPEYALRQRLRSRIRCAVIASNKKRVGGYMDLAGCTAEQLRSHIQSQFAVGMTWDNKHMWHIDHIIPVSAFDLSTEEGQHAAFHYTNMRPMWANENRKKHAKPPLPQRRFSFGYVILADTQRMLGAEGRLGTERKRA
jgi:hypothetical protein